MEKKIEKIIMIIEVIEEKIVLYLVFLKISNCGDAPIKSNSYKKE